MPDDPTPHGGEAFHAPPERARIPAERAPDPRKDRGQGADDARPPLPGSAPEMPADRAGDAPAEGARGEDDTRPPSVTRQPA